MSVGHAEARVAATSFRPSPERALFRHRADIDGLRAIAILPVVLYHAGVPGFGGGFVGVDVFFVISGFLITALILEDLRMGRFRLLAFYERRIRRILPALFTVCAFCLAVAFFIFLPSSFRDLGRSLASTMLFVSNLYFWKTADYFGGGGELAPLLHTWSLAVEEQFYVFFPLCLALAWRFGRAWLVGAMLAASVLSFGLGLWGVANFATATFYLAPPRAWELLLGALVAMDVFPVARSRVWREAAALIGLGMIGWAVASFSSVTTFPGANALLPCIGAALIIQAGARGHNTVGSILSTAPLVLIGLVSYSLYLWHWPLFVFARYYAIADLTPVDRAVVLLLSALAALCSWQFVEKPFRRKGARLSGSSLFVGTAGLTATFLALGLAVGLSHGWPWRVSAEVARLDAFSHDVDIVAERCGDPTLEEIKEGKLCRIGAENSTTDWLVWGDSHASAFQAAFSAWLAERGSGGWIAARGGCIPLFGVSGAKMPPNCRAFNATVDDFVRRHGIKNVILVSMWTGYLDHELRDDQSQEAAKEETKRVIDRGVSATLSRLTDLGTHVYILDPVPEAKEPVPMALARALEFGSTVDIAYSADEYVERNKVFLDAFQGNRHLIFAEFAPEDELCDAGKCRVTQDGVPLYFDSHHPSAATKDVWLELLNRNLRYLATPIDRPE